MSLGLLAKLRRDLASREVWDEALVALLRGLRGRAKTAIVSNAWPGIRARMSQAGMLDIADQVILSCEAGYAKPDRASTRPPCSGSPSAPPTPCSSTTRPATSPPPNHSA
jgi:hypothetical protein